MNFASLDLTAYSVLLKKTREEDPFEEISVLYLLIQTLIFNIVILIDRKSVV